LVIDGTTEIEAEKILKDTDSAGKNELLFSKYNINYNNLEPMFRKGSVLYRSKTPSTEISKTSGEELVRMRLLLVTDHCDLIGNSFWDQHPDLLI
jgi:tRNA(His) guanylyltransferase